MKPTTAFTALAVATTWLLGCGDATGPVVDSTVDDFEWRGRIAQGNRIEIKGIAGGIQAHPIAGDQVVVTAVKRGPADELADVSIEVVAHDHGVTICAVYPDVPGERPNECAPGDAGHMSQRDTVGGTVRVTFTVQVPEGVEFVGRTVSGDVEATDLRSDAFVETVSGDARVFTTGIATAQTVNGSVTATIGQIDWGRDLEFATVSGDVTVMIPAGANARIEMEAVAGSLTSEFPLTEVGPGAAYGVIGAGGPTITLSTVAGNVRLLRRP
jgi:hypothetical protein